MAKVNHTLPPTFELKDLNDEALQGIFYTQEISRVANPNNEVAADPSEGADKEAVEPVNESEETEQQAEPLSNEEPKSS